MIRQKSTLMQQGTSVDVPIAPEKHIQVFYRSMVARLQFVATWVRFNTSYTVGQLARFCASAGSSHFEALHHLMEYLKKHLSFRLDSTEVLRRSQVSIVIVMRTGERATAVDRSLVTSFGTTEHQSHGNPSFRSWWRSQLLRQSTT